MKQKTYQTAKPKEEKKIIIKGTDLNIPNKMHLDAQQRFPALIQEDKRRKKPKYKKKIFEEN